VTSERCPAVYADETDRNRPTISWWSVLLRDKIYPNRHPLLMTPYTRQLTNLQHKCAKVKHAIGDLKLYNVLGKLWRHKR